MTNSSAQSFPPAAEPEAAAAPADDQDETPCPSEPTIAAARERVAPNAGESRSRRRFWLDVTTALVFSAMVGSGTLLALVLPPRGGGTWLGWTRHEWGDLHLWLGVTLLALVVLHLVEQRQWIARCWSRFVGTPRSPATWALLLAGAALMAAPLLIPPQPGGSGRQPRGAGARVADGAAAERAEDRAPRRGGGRRAALRGERRWQHPR